MNIAIEILPDNTFNVCEDDAENGATFDTFASGTIGAGSEWYADDAEDTELLFGEEARDFLRDPHTTITSGADAVAEVLA